MRARLIAVGERMPGWVAEGFAEYRKRLSHWLPLERMHAAWDGGEVVGGAGAVPLPSTTQPPVVNGCPGRIVVATPRVRVLPSTRSSAQWPAGLAAASTEAGRRMA